MAETKNKQQAEETSLMQQTVHIKLPKTRELTEDVWVGINGRSWLIQRGVAVEVPWNVAKVLARREKSLAQAMAFEAQAAQPLQSLEGR